METARGLVGVGHFAPMNMIKKCYYKANLGIVARRLGALPSKESLLDGSSCLRP